MAIPAESNGDTGERGNDVTGREIGVRNAGYAVRDAGNCVRNALIGFYEEANAVRRVFMNDIIKVINACLIKEVIQTK